MGKIDTYKNSLGHGARSNLFAVQIEIPAVASVGLIVTRKANPKNDYSELLNTMVHSVVFPNPQVTRKHTIQYKGGYFDLPDIKEDYSDIVIKFRNAQNFLLRDLFEIWANKIQVPANGVNFNNGSDPNLIKSRMRIIWLNNKRMPIKYADCSGIFPTVVAAPQVLEYSNGEITETEVTFSVDSYVFKTNPSINLIEETKIIDTKLEDFQETR